MSTWATWLPGLQKPQAHLRAPDPALRHAWRMLIQCHPHDSICGCSIDQVHDEMRPRFDQVEQIASEITRQSLEILADSGWPFTVASKKKRKSQVSPWRKKRSMRMS